MVKNGGLKRRMFALSVTLACGSLLVSAVEIAALTEVTARFSRSQSAELPAAELTGRLASHGKDLAAAALRLGLSSGSREERARAIDLLRVAQGRYLQATEELRSISLDPEAAAGLEELDAIWKSLSGEADRLVLQSSDYSAAGRERLQELLRKDFEKQRLQHQAKLEGFIDMQRDVSSAGFTRSTRAARVALWVSILIGAAAFFGALAIGYFFSKSLSATLSDIAGRLSREADELAGASRRISTSSEALSTSATGQAEALEQTAASIEEMGAMVNRNAQNANRSREVSGKSQTTAAKGREVVDEMIRAIGEINDSNAHIMQEIEENNRQISAIVTMIGEIGSKTKVINDIVFQTKLLSFNASVEAARAGEHGKGFAVVAEEVGNLAQMSGSASREISAMLDGSIHKVEKIVADTRSKVEKLVQVGHEKVRTGTETARRCGEVLTEIVRDVSEVNKMTGEISTASADQAQGVDGITKAIGQLDQVTQETAQSAQHAAGAALQLSEQVENLRGLARTLVRTVQGDETPSPDPGAPLATGLSLEPAAQVIPFPTAALPPKAGQEAVAFRPVEQVLSGVPSKDDPRFKEG